MAVPATFIWNSPVIAWKYSICLATIDHMPCHSPQNCSAVGAVIISHHISSIITWLCLPWSFIQLLLEGGLAMQMLLATMGVMVYERARSGMWAVCESEERLITQQCYSFAACAKFGAQMVAWLPVACYLVNQLLCLQSSTLKARSAKLLCHIKMAIVNPHMSSAHAPACAHVFHISGYFRSILTKLTENVPMTSHVLFDPGLVAALHHCSLL